jgi:two-component system, chemotaxis family, chemotaxis protein CheY
MKILIADDSRVMRQIVIRTLRQAGLNGHDLVEAENGKDALEKARADEPDFVLSDWNMPEMTGIEFLRALRGDGIQTPFIFVTSEATTGMRETAIAAGALDLITKPFDAETFGKVLEPILR